MNDWMPWKSLAATVNVGVATEGWNLAEFNGADFDKPRIFTVDVYFSAPFTIVPVVQLALSGFDIDRHHSARLSIRAVDISTHGFKAEIGTWSDTRVYSVEATWLAIGP
jgi:hypothetical protein